MPDVHLIQFLSFTVEEATQGPLPSPAGVAHLPDQVVLRVGHIHHVSSDGHSLWGVEERLGQVAVFPPAPGTCRSRGDRTPSSDSVTETCSRTVGRYIHSAEY